jgi:subtilisin family serine protease
VTAPVRIGIIDSGVNPLHSHVGNIAGGISIQGDRQAPSYLDQLGHGTAVAALIHAIAPQVHLFPVKVFQRSLATNLATVLHAIDWCIDQKMHIINLSLGTTNVEHRDAFALAVARSLSSGSVIVSAMEMNGAPALPGCLTGVVGVSMDPACPEHEYRVTQRGGKLVFCASPFPRSIPGVPRERNLQGISFAVARLAGFLARRWPVAASVDCEQFLATQVSSEVGHPVSR